LQLVNMNQLLTQYTSIFWAWFNKL
jgi:hypothetical protein